MKNTYLKFFIFILFLIIWIYLFNTIDFLNIINKIGIKNSYIILFFISLFGGASTFTSSSYIISIATFSIFGLNPILLAFFGGLGLTIGDFAFYSLGKVGRDTLPLNLKNKIDNVQQKFFNNYNFSTQIFCYIYTGFTPLPADLLMIYLSFLKYSFKKVLVPIFLGNMTLVLIIYYLSTNGYKFYYGL